MKKRSSFKIFMDVQKALFFRELGMRFTSGRMGLFWTFFEPFFQILIFILIKLLLFGSTTGNFDFAIFLALNFTAFNMFKNIVMKSVSAFKANKAIFLYKQVKPIDTIIARTTIEVFITSIIIVIFFGIGFYFNFDMKIKDLTMVTLGFLFLILFSFSFGLLMAMLVTFFETIEKLLSFAMTGLMFGSAVFYTLDSLPQNLQKLLLYNPLIHFLEMIHGNYFIALDDTYIDYTYMLLWILSSLFIGLWLYIKREKRIISS